MKRICFYLLLTSAISVCNAQHQTANQTPQATSKTLFDAWRTRNKANALQVATKAAVDKLFGTVFRTQRKLTGCHDASQTEKGLYYCVYKDSEDDLLSVAFYMRKTKNGWLIHQVSFSAED